MCGPWCRARCVQVPRISREQAQGVFSSFILGLLVVCNLVPFGLGLLVTSVGLFVWFGQASWSFYASDFTEHSGYTLVAQADSERGGFAAAPTVASPPSQRLQYLDTLKACLTVLVVVHHTAGAFAGAGSLGLSVGNYRNALQPLLVAFQILQQSYFMSLFFFISAYFSPATVARKGVLGFLKDRLTRLGLPFLPFLLVLGPLAQMSAQYAITGAVGYAVYSGPLWFVVWLGVFHFGYATVAEAGGVERYLELPLPSVGAFALAGGGLGLLQGLQLLFFPGFPLMPISFGSLPFDIAFYTGGVVARRNRWLEAPLPPCLVACARVYSALFIVGVFAFFGWLYSVGGGLQLLSTNACDAAAPSRGDLTAGSALGSTLGAILALATLSGGFTFFMSIALLDLFRQGCSSAPSPLTKFFSDNAYAAYIIHPLAVFPLTAGFIAYTRKATGLPVNLWTQAPDSQSCLTSDGSEAAALTKGLAAVTALSLLATYALAPAVRMIPGTKMVLG